MAGQVISHTGLTISETFQAFSIYCSSVSTIFFVVYLLKGKDLEAIRIEKVDHQRRHELERNFEKKNIEDKVISNIKTSTTYL